MLGNLLNPVRSTAGRKQPTLNVLGEGDTIMSSDRLGMMELFGASPTAAGAPVTERSAMRVSAVYACVRLIAGVCADLPLPIYERNGEDRAKVDHDYWWLLNERPNPVFSSATFWEFVVAQVLLRGDSPCYLVRNRAGRVTAILPWKRSQVHIQKVKDGDPRTPPRLQYFFQGDEGYFGADQDDVLHFPGFGFDGCTSMSVIEWGARNGIGIAIRGDEFAGKFFSQGAQPQFALKTSNKMTTKQQEDLREAWVSKYSGNGPNGIPLVLTEGLDVKELTMTAADAQLLESRQWQVIDIARAFGIPPFMIAEMGKATYNNTENLSTDFVKFTLGPHLKRWKDELNFKLFSTAKLFTEHNTNALMKGDAKTRGEYYKAALGGTQNPGWMTQDEIRRLENLPAAAGGDRLYAPKESDNVSPQKQSA